jgi:imidazolonepropionase-like amidohydrolase
MVGPRVFAAGFGLQKATGPGRAGAPAGPPRGRVRDTSEVWAAVKAQVDAGADVIKMYGSTGSGSNVTGQQTFTFAEMKAAVDAATRLGKRIAIHSYGPEGARDAMRAGAASVEHATDVDDAILAEWARRGTIYVPTIDHNRFYADNAAELRYTDEQVAGLKAYIARNLETARKAHRAGIKFAMGSDAVYWMFGENTRELRWFVEAGMTPAQALEAATVNGAELLGMPTKLGKVAPGFYADLVAVDGDPLADIGVVVDKVRWVMKAGAVVVDKR